MVAHRCQSKKKKKNNKKKKKKKNENEKTEKIENILFGKKSSQNYMAHECQIWQKMFLFKKKTKITMAHSAASGT